MKRLIAQRMLQRQCIHCNCSFKKGDVYYKQRTVYDDPDGIFALEHIICPKCNYKMNDRDKRKRAFIVVCPHPEAMLEDIWMYMPGEAVMEPSHCECRLCRKCL